MDDYIHPISVLFLFFKSIVYILSTGPYRIYYRLTSNSQLFSQCWQLDSGMPTLSPPWPIDLIMPDYFWENEWSGKLTDVKKNYTLMCNLSVVQKIFIRVLPQTTLYIYLFQCSRWWNQIILQCLIFRILRLWFWTHAFSEV